MRTYRLTGLAILALTASLLVACGSTDTPTNWGGVAGIRGQGTLGEPADAAGPVRIGSKNFTEQLILGHMYAQLLEANGIQVERNLNLGGTMVAHQALVSGKIDLYPEYTGTGLLVVLKEPSQSDSAAVYDTVSREYNLQYSLVWLDQAPMNNSQALAVKRTFAEERQIGTISDLARISSGLTIVAPPDFSQREDGLLGLQRVYDGLQFKEVKAVDPGIKYRVLHSGQAEVALAFGTDGQIEGYNLLVLEDDRDLWPPYHVAPVVRKETVELYPNLPRALNQLAPHLTDGVMRGLNWQVDGPQKEDPADVARQFLAQKGLVRP